MKPNADLAGLFARIKADEKIIYSGAGIAELRRIRRDLLVFKVFDYVRRKIPARTGEDYITSGLNSHECALWYSWDLDCEVLNGGFSQYFGNRPNRLDSPLIEAYALIGTSRHRDLFRSAYDCHKRGLGALSETELTRLYYGIKPSMQEVLECFILSNPNAFTE